MDGVVEDGEITSIYKTGLHRTQKEADKMNAFALQVIGGNMTYEKNSLKVGVTGFTIFQPSLQASVEQVCKVQSSWK